MVLRALLLNYRKVGILIALIALAGFASSALGMSSSQSVAVTVIISFILGTLLFWDRRVAFAFTGIALLLAFGVLDIAHLVEFASLDIILFLMGMMIIVGYLEENHFFEYLLSKVMRYVGKSPTMLILFLMLASSILAALVDEVTSVLIMASMVFNLSDRYRVSPVPLLLMVIFATNIGSSATVVGNPVGVMIAFRSGLSFEDFLRNATPISALALLLAIPVCLRLFSSEIAELGRAMHRTSGSLASAAGPARKGRLPLEFLVSGTLFVGVLGFLLLHHQVEEMFLLSKNSLLLGTALAGASLVMFLKGSEARRLFETRVDWWTLTFFMLLFASVGALKYVGVTDLLSSAMFSVSGTNSTFTLALVMISTGLLSAVLDNVLAVAVFVPVVQGLGEAGAEIGHLWWAMLFGGTLFGNLTVIGSTANVVALGMLERQRQMHVPFLEWLKYGAYVTVPTALLAGVLLWVQHVFLAA